MGLDILIFTNDHEDLLSGDYFDEMNNNINQHWLSRTFCNFMLRRESYGESELDQIQRIASVDLTPLKDMEKNWEEEDITHQLSFAKTETDKVEILRQIHSDKDKINGNIDLVLKTLHTLINNLSKVDNIHQKLNYGSEDTLGYDYYFTDFNTNKIGDYSNNNFGQDLRNFKRFLEFAMSKGRTSVWFHYG